MEDDLKELLRHLMDDAGGDEYGWTPLHHAAASGEKRLVELLLKYGAEVQCDFDGETPLDAAVKSYDIHRKSGHPVSRKSAEENYPDIIRTLEEAMEAAPTKEGKHET